MMFINGLPLSFIDGAFLKYVGISTGFTWFMCKKALKSFGKKDYADIVRLGGWYVYGCTIVQIYQFIMENSIIINFLKDLF